MQIGDPERERRYQVISAAILTALFIVGALAAIGADAIWPHRGMRMAAAACLVFALAGLWQTVNARR